VEPDFGIVWRNLKGLAVGVFGRFCSLGGIGFVGLFGGLVGIDCHQLATRI